MNLSEDKFVPIIVFSINSDIKVKTNKPVIYIVKFKKEILSYQNIIIELNEIEKIAKEIVSLNICSYENSKKHVKKIKENIMSEKVKIENGSCPKCDGTLLKRKGKYGEFTGCSNYPKCRFVLK